MRDLTDNERRENSWVKLNQANTALEASYANKKQRLADERRESLDSEPLTKGQLELLRQSRQIREADALLEERREAEQARIKAATRSFK